jgi:UDP-glucose 4-epimerase
LLGRHVEASLETSVTSPVVWRPNRQIEWNDLEGAAARLQQEAAEFLRHAVQSGRTWRLLWCAGAGVIATSTQELEQETILIGRFLAWLAGRLSDDRRLAGAGTLFFASSAGGVYSASKASPPFDETSPVGALNPYGCEKLKQEVLFTKFAEALGVDLLVGRLSNLYGPGQNLAKPQGLISHVGQSALRREPVSIYVSLDTIRDYLFAPDAGRMVVEAVHLRDEARSQGLPLGPSTKIFASEVETTVASILGAWRQTLRRPLRIALATNSVGHLQPRILSFRSHVWPDVRGQPTPLTLGIDAVKRDQLARMLAVGVG